MDLLAFHPAPQGLDLLVEERSDLDGTTLRLALRNDSHEPIALGRLGIGTDLIVAALVEHGYQSWSTVRPTRPDDVRPVRSEAPRWFRNQMLAQGEEAGRTLCADTVLLHPDGLVATTWLDGPPLSLLVDRDGRVTISLDLADIVIHPGETLPAARLRCAEGTPGPLLSEWASLTGEAAGARTTSRTPLGWCSWYQYFTAVTSDHILDNLAVAAAHDLALVQVDDGWQPSIGEWSGTAARFGMPIGDVAAAIRSRGISAGIWTAPFLAIEGGPLATANPTWLVTNDRGRPRTALHHGGWGGRVFALDLSQDAVIDHVANQFAHLHAIGFDYFKIDFLHAALVPGGRAGGGGRTRTECFRAALSAIRSAIGEDSTLLGCGSPLAPAVGLVDAMRVSEDVAPHWAAGDHFPGWAESSVGAANAIEASVRRAPLHRRWFASDPDCVLLRPTDSQLSTGERHAIAATAAGTGGFVVLSDDLGTYGSAEWDLVEGLRSSQAVVDGPLDLLDPLSATHLEVTGTSHRLTVDLTARSASLEGTGIPRSLRSAATPR